MTALLPDRLVVEVVERVLADEAKAGVVAVLLRGSHARGTGDAHSDLDVTAVTHGDPAAPYRTWFAERPGLPPLHVSVGARAIERWLEHGRRPAQWALGLPAIEEARYLWRTDGAAALLGDPPNRRHPADVPEVEDFEASVKAARGMRVRDPVSLRVHSRIAAELAPRLLLGVNPAPLACDRRDAIRLALELPEAPTGYRGDMTLCLGLASGEDEAVAEASERLATGLLALLRARNAAVDPQQRVSVALSSGAFERHVTAAFAAAPR